MIETKTAKDTNLENIFNRNISEIHSQNYTFNRPDQEVIYLKRVTKEEIVEVFQLGVKNNNRLLIVAVEGNPPDSPNGTKEQYIEENIPPGDAFDDFRIITNISDFRNAHEFICRNL